MRKNLSESILLNLQEDINESSNYLELMNSLDSLVNELSGIAKKYFTEDTVKTIATFCSNVVDKDNVTVKRFTDDGSGNGFPKSYLSSVHTSEGNVLYVYSPIMFTNYGEDGQAEIIDNCLCNIMVNMNMSRQMFSKRPSFHLTDAGTGMADVISENDEELLEIVADILNNKEHIIERVETFYNHNINAILDIMRK